MIGRLGNQMFQYAYARARAEREGRRLHTNSWLGQRMFMMDDPPLEPGLEMLPEHYRQDQESVDAYSRADARRWFAWRSEVWAELYGALGTRDGKAVGHLRRGDYLACGYPVVSKVAVIDAAMRRQCPPGLMLWCCEENPWVVDGFEGEMACVPDFYMMTRAAVLFRSNSSFSWWAAVLMENARARVFAPVIEGLKGGVVHDAVRFVEGNWPRLAELPGIGEMRLRDA